MTNAIIRDLYVIIVSGRFIILPLLYLLMPLLELVFFKSIIRDAGELIEKDSPIEAGTKKAVKFFKFYPWLLMLMGSYFVLAGAWIGILVLLYGLWINIGGVKAKAYKKRCGLYENAIVIMEEIILYDKIHSWNLDSNNVFTIYKKDGLKRTYSPTYDKNLLVKKLESKVGLEASSIM